MSEQTELNVSPQQASAVLQFLQRTQMQGAEMPAYVDVFNTLSAIVASAPQELKEAVADTETPALQ